MDYLVNNLSSLELLETDKRRKHRIRKIKLDIQDTDQFQRYEKKINEYYFACGCKEGAIGVYISLICCFLAWWLFGDFIPVSWWMVLAAMAASAIGGKISGLLISSYKLKQIFRTLKSHLKN